ncbi:Ribosomal RNA adenine dimethylase domain-containing protein 1 [Boothiomyces macroporosus]|uniref:Ribosomal RNA adenine dimethylase domain-containing protein 1 n=1 Tax=Boothiomyces macroporosus TaxID=261099 RepID=A0AAD5Y2H2_9FUNG|nr:Ribosomal RNA adenine dimethylase domain-containing protein 1 [Boothiomyces macroporosus]
MNLINFYNKHKFISQGHYFDIYQQAFTEYPTDWIEFITSSSDEIVDDFASALLNNTISDSFPQSLKEWIKDTKSMYLDKQPKNIKELDINVKFVKHKKMHEIKRLGALVLDTMKSLNVDYIVDIGAGVGHLTNVLSEHYPVIAIECNKELSNQIKKNDNVIIVDKYIDKTNLISILDDIKPTGTFLLTGLHSCGDLSSAITLDAFKNCDRVKAVITVGCCFQLISEFPKSNHFKDSIQLTKAQLNSACHVYSDFNIPRLNAYWKSLGYRARLNEMLNLDLGTKLRFPSNVTFEQYVDIANKQLGTNAMPTDGEKYLKMIAFISLLRSVFSPVLEKIIQLDRLLYLQQDGYEAKLVALFDPILSPRNMVLIALKT